MTRETLTQEVFDFIVAYKRSHDGNSPTLREIGERVNASTSVVSSHITKLIETGKLVKSGLKDSRNVEVVGARWIYDDWR